MSKLVEPHGGNGLKALLAPQAERAAELDRARGLRKVPMTSREVSDVPLEFSRPEVVKILRDYYAGLAENQ